MILHIISPFILLFSLGDSNYLGTNTDCIEPCVRLMQNTIGKTDRFTQMSIGKLRESDRMTVKGFEDICREYEEGDNCLRNCESQSEHAAWIRQHTYAGLRFICKERRTEFFKSLPCLARYEEQAVEVCSQSINSSLAASMSFANAVMKRDSHGLKPTFEELCVCLGKMVDCIEPITRDGCGPAAASMMMKFITVGFGSFEQIYAQLGITDHLPSSCRKLISPQSSTYADRVIASNKSSIHSTSILILFILTIFIDKLFEIAEKIPPIA